MEAFVTNLTILATVDIFTSIIVGIAVLEAIVKIMVFSLAAVKS
ncbi:MAG: hypothetical protein V7K35_26895 [Nostoc sp.]